MGLRLSQKVSRSRFRRTLAPALAQWLKAQWTRITEQETFRLKSPLQTVPPVTECLSEDRPPEAFAASLLLVAADAVGMSLGEKYRLNLAEIGAGKR
jgi:hypothetical protein